MELALLITACAAMIATLAANKLGALPPGGRLDRLSGQLNRVVLVIAILFLLWRERFDLLAIILVVGWAFVLPYVERKDRLFWTGVCATIGVLGWTLQVLLGDS